ncbi:MAG: DUF2924 domain-containing protein [Pseudomonadota bacterium]
MTVEQELKSLSREALKARWFEVLGTTPAPRLSSGMMVRILTCELQWKASGQPRTAIRRRLDKVVDQTPDAKPKAQTGVRLVREWHGEEHIVDVTAHGYHWNGSNWKSLSAIAKEITGTKWSGPRFFGVKT